MKKTIHKLLLFVGVLCWTTMSYGQFITETAGTTTTVAAADGEIFTDPTDGTNGGPGGDCSTTSSGNLGDYPNCNCITVTTLSAPAGSQISVTFTQFRVFGAFDWMAIFDGSGAVTATNGSGSASNPTSGDPELWNSSVDGDELIDMTNASSVTFTSTNGNLTFASRFSGVVNTCGWEASVSIISPPLNNDDCADAFAINCGETVSGSTIGQTPDAAPFCGTSNTAPGVWYSWTGDGSAVTLSTCTGTSYDSKLTVYSGSCGALACVGGNDDTCGLQSEVSFVSSVGTDYLILVHGFSASEGDFDLTMTCVPPPPNDAVCAAIPLTLGVPEPADGALASAQAGEPSPGAGTGGSSCNSQDGWCFFEIDVQNSLWYTFVAPDCGPLDIETTGSGDTQLALWTVTDCTDFGTFTEVAGNDDGGAGLLSLIDDVVVIPGTTYWVQVDGFAGNAYDVNVEVRASNPVPINLSCPLDIVTTASPGTCGAVVAFAAPLASGGCGTITVTQTSGDPSGSLFPVGDTLIEFTAIDEGGTSETCTFTITITDDEAPAAVCMDVTVQLDANGEYVLTTAEIDGGSTDNCSIASLEIGGNPSITLDCSNVGDNTITLTVTDDSGNVSTCDATVTVEDVTAPEVFCIGEPSVFSYLQEFEGSSLPTDWSTQIDVGVWDWTFGSGDLPTGDDFPTNAAIFDDDAAGIGEVNVISMFSPIFDLDGAILANLSYDVAFQEAGDQEFSIEVWDGAAWQQIDFYDEDMDPDIQSMSFDVLAYANPDFQVRFFFDDLGGWGWHAAIDNFQLDYEFSPSSPLVVELDANGMATINSSDLIDSVNEACGYTVTGGTDTTELIVNGSFETMDLSDWTAIDNPNPFLPWGAYEFNDGAGFFDPALPTDGGWLAGNGFDGEAGEAVLYQDVSVPPGIVGATLTWDENIDYDLASFCTGCQDRIYEVQVRDLSDNVLEVLVQITATAGELESDNVWVSQTADLSAYAGQDIRIAYWQNMPDDFSGPAKFALDNVSLSAETPATTIDFDCSHLGLNTIDVTVTDDSGNTATCTATVEVLDVTAPILVCQDVTIGVGPDGTTEIDPEILLANMPSTYEVIAISSNNGSGAEGFTDFTVDVTADETVSFDWEYSTDDGPAWDRFGYTVNGTFTELTDENGANNQSGSASVPLVAGDVFGFRAQSEDGNFGAATTVVSNFAPGFEGQFDTANWTLTLDNSDGDAFFVEIPGGPLSFDACGITVLAVDVTEVTCDDVGTTITATVFASDASGNIASCTSQITVVDELGPEITCPADQTVDPGPGNLFYEVPDYFATGEATATDNCTDPVTITSQDPAAGTLIPDGTYTVTLTAEDEYGNVSTCEFELTVESVLGLDDNALDSAIALYPNPASSAVTLANTSGTPLDKAAIYDTNGRLVQTIDLRDMQQEKVIDVSTLATGVYMVMISSEDASTVKRLVKE